MKKSMKLHRKLLLFSIVFIVIVFFLIFLMSLAILHFKENVKFAFLSLAAFAILIVVWYALFLFYIYTPISKLEKSIEELEKGSDYSSLDLSDSVSGITDALNHMFRLFKESLQSEHKSEMLRKQAEISVLQNNINPHFLYNTLEVIRGEAIIQDNREVAEMTEALANYFRYNISKKGNFVTLGEELDNVESYFTIQKYRFSNRIFYRVLYHGTDKSVLNYLIPKLTLQPVIENAIYHGLEMKMGKGAVTVHITETDRFIMIMISDDGLGIDAATLENLNAYLKNEVVCDHSQSKSGRHLGIALYNINERLKLFGGKQCGLTISSTVQKGTDVEITLPKFLKDDEIRGIK